MKRTACSTLALLFAVCMPRVGASELPPAAPGTLTATAIGVDARIVTAMQDQFALGEAEVLQWLSAQSDAALADEQLRVDTGAAYAGAWLTGHGTMHIAVTNKTAADLVSAAGIDVVVVAHSQAELEAFQRSIDTLLADFGTKVPLTYIDVAANRVVVEARTKILGEVQARLGRGALPADAYTVIATSRQPESFIDVVGGNGFNMTGGSCSVGFAVDNGFVTAGHCARAGNQTFSPSGHFAGASFPGDDYAYVQVTPDNAPLPYVNNHGGGLIEVKGSQDVPIGSAVCRSGYRTGLRCGTLQARDATVNFPLGTVYGLIQTSACAEPGDSGGPLVAGNQAQGMTSGGSGNCSVGGTTFFQPVREALQRYGLTLKVVGVVIPPGIDHPPFGYLDLVADSGTGSGIRVAGWAMDEDMAPKSTPIEIDISIDGRSTPRVTANKPRQDVAAAYPGYGPNHGFATVLSAGVGAHTVCAWARNAHPYNGSAHAANTALGCVTVQVIRPGSPTDPTGPIVSLLTNGCVDVAGGNSASGTPVWMYQCNGTLAQKWQFAGDQSVRAFGKCLDAVYGGTTNGTHVQLFECNGTGAQKWERFGDHTLRNPQSGRCLEIFDFNPADGAPIGLWDCHGLSNQQWLAP